ncbi:MAG: GAF domain-containing SpoIIE family protein phosphatase, partial [Anaerolineales bacterium]
AEATAHANELNEVLETVARLTPLLVGVDRCAVLLAKDEAFVLKAYDGAEIPGTDLNHLPGFGPEAWPKLAEMLATREPVVMDPDDPMPLELRALFGGVVILLPLLAKGRVEGVLMVGQIPGEVPFTAHRIRLIGGIANQTAVAIESALLYQSQQEEAWVSTALLQVAEAVAGQPLEAGLETVARLTPLLVGIEKIAICQWDGESRVFRVSQVMGVERAVASEVVGLLATADELRIDYSGMQAQYECHLPERLARAFDSEKGLIWPLRAGGGLLGALIVEHVPALGRRLSILNGIAHQLAMAMENARLAHEVAMQQRFEREMEVARDIQASFLPDACPRVPGWEMCSFWRAARQVGGDFYD